nr:hypothetical protein [Rubrobacter sp.]
MPRRVRLTVFLSVVFMLSLVTGISAGAAPEDDIRSKEADIAEAQDRLMEIRVEESTASAAFSQAISEMNRLNLKIEDASKDLDVAEEDLSEAQKSLEDRASQVYKSGNVAFIDVLVDTDDFSDFAARLDVWVKLLSQERDRFERVREARNELAERRQELEDRRAKRVQAVDKALAEKKRAVQA